jgi:hypothetical protein
VGVTVATGGLGTLALGGASLQEVRQLVRRLGWRGSPA